MKLFIVFYLLFSVSLSSISFASEVGTKNKKSINIIAIGDSLTAGFTNDRDYYPYTDFLKKSLDHNFGDDFNFEIVNYGLPGYTSSEILESEYFEQHINFRSWDFVIYLAGTNDLGKKISTTKVIENLSSVYNLTQEMISRPTLVVLSVPESSATKENYPELINARNIVNEKIAKFAENSKNVMLADLNNYIPFEFNGRMWFYDGLHFSKEGYEEMAKLIYETIKPYFQQK